MKSQRRKKKTSGGEIIGLVDAFSDMRYQKQ